ncbi:MAG: hypothetical protein NTV80_08005 [Verrucomicrobia bacterium]|nr:hypothetical protein [Verrucomicrobiota bacterium]
MTKSTLRTRCAIALAGAALSLTNAHADEYLWSFARNSQVLPKGETELVTVNTFRFGKNTGSYFAWDSQAELEYGLTDKFLISGSILAQYFNFKDVPFDPYTDRRANDLRFSGFNLNMKYNILSPFKDSIGLAVGFAYIRRDYYRLDGAPTDQNSFRPAIFLEKNFLDDTLSFAWSTGVEFERRRFRDAEGIKEEEISIESALGVSYRFRPNWNIGFEVYAQGDFLEAGFNNVNDLNLGRNFQHGIHIGPSIHYSNKKWWATLGVVTQLYGGPDRGTPDSDSGKNWDEHERMMVRLSIAFDF